MFKENKASSYLIWILIAGTVIVPALLFALVAGEDRQSILREAEQDVAETADAFREHVLKVFETQELVATVIDQRIRSMSWDEIGASRDLHDYVTGLQARYPQVQGVWLVDANGMLRSSSRALPAPAVDLSDRDYFVALRRADVGTFISNVVPGRVYADEHFNVARRRSGGSGFDGVIVVSVYPSYFTEFWRRASSSADMLTTLLTGDGKILARHPAAAVEQVPQTSALMAALRQVDQGSLRTTSTVDGIERLVAFRHVGHFDAAIVHGIGFDAAMTRWHDDLWAYGAFFGLASAALLTAALLMVQRIHRERIATERWRVATHSLIEETERRQAAEEQLHQAEKMEALGQLTGGLAHDFNNLLSIILGNLDLLRGQLGDPHQEARVENAITAAERAEQAIRSLLVFARRKTMQVEMVGLRDLLAQSEPMLRQAIGSGSTLMIETAADLWPIEADAGQLELALLNMVVNARDAMPDGGTLRIAASNARLAGTPAGLTGEFVRIAVADTGIGMPPEVVARIFEPFFTTKEPGKGTGLGLSQVYGFATHSGGTVTVDSAPGAGTTIAVYLRRAVAAEPVRATPLPRSASAHRAVEPRGSVILVVEDEKEIRRMAADVLREEGHTLIEAASGDEALPIVHEHPEIDLILTDVRMPGRTDGVALAREAKRLRPDIKILFATGYDSDVLRNGADVPENRILRKPYRASQARQAVDHALAG